MSTCMAGDRTSAIRPLADAELNEVTGGAAAVIAGTAAVVLIGAAIGYYVAKGIMGGPIGVGIKAGMHDAGL